MQKAETSTGVFYLNGLRPGAYFLDATYVGLADLRKTGIQLEAGMQLDLGDLTFSAAAIELIQATVTAARALVEVKPDRTVFNVEGTINTTDGGSIARITTSLIPSITNLANFLSKKGTLTFVLKL